MVHGAETMLYQRCFNTVTKSAQYLLCLIKVFFYNSLIRPISSTKISEPSNVLNSRRMFKKPIEITTYLNIA